MNRQEALEKLENYFYWNCDDEEYDQEADEKHKQNLENIIKYLKQHITLIDYLGWEKDAEYIVQDKKYKIIDNKLYRFDNENNEWFISFLNEELIEFQQTKKTQPKKYYLRLKEKYRKFYGIMNNLIYLNLDKTTDKNFLSNSNNYKACQTQFTQKEIEDIKNRDYIPFEQFEMVEVGEDE